MYLVIIPYLALHFQFLQWWFLEYLQTSSQSYRLEIEDHRKHMKKYSKRTLLANTFGSLGYIFCLILWGWVGILYVPMLLENEQVVRILLPPPSDNVMAPQPATEPSATAVIVAVGVTIVVLITTVVVLLRIPVTIAKTGKTVTTKAANSAIPLITRGHPISPAKRRRLTTELVKLAKLLFMLLPVAIGLLGFFIEPPLPLDLSLFVSSILALSAVLCFSAQYISARLLAIDSSSLV